MEIEGEDLLDEEDDASDNNPNSDAHDPSADHDNPVAPENAIGNDQLIMELIIIEINFPYNLSSTR